MKNFMTLLILLSFGITMYASSVQDIVEETLLRIRANKVDKYALEQARKYPGYYTLKEDVKIKVREIEPPQDLPPIIDSGLVAFNNKSKGLDVYKGVTETVVVIDKIVNIASKIWDMVVNNKPALKVNTKYACALPYGVQGPSELSGWSKPKSYLVSFYFENLWGMDVIKVSYQVTYVYGGNYKGKGKYLAAVWAIPVKVDVMWGFTFNMYAYVPSQTIVNVGTSQDPIAALQLRVSWSASTILKETSGTAVYYIQGDGYFDEIASPFRRSKVDLSNLKNVFNQ